MTQIIKIKRTTTTAIPTVEFGEIAYTDIAGVSKVFIGNSSNVPVEIAGDNKMDKVSGATANNILTVDADGQAQDSGYLIESTLTGSATAIPSSSAIQSAIQISQQGLDTKQSATAATAASLIVTAAGSGVGKTLTATINGVLFIDGVSTWVDVNIDGGSTNPYATTNKASRVLIKNQVNAIDNGIYVVTDKGSASTPFVLTRSIDADDGTQLNPQAFIFVESGTTNANSGFTLSNTSPITIDTTPLTFTQFSGAGSITAGAGLAKTGNTLSVKPDTTTVGSDIANVINATSAGLSVLVDGTTIGGNGATALSVLDGAITGAKITTNTIANSNLTQASANTWKGNNTGALANVSDNPSGSLTESTSSVLTITGGANALLNNSSIEVKQATTSQDGYLASADWNTFNNKVAIDSQQTLSATGSITAWNSTVYVSGTSNITLPTPTSNAGKKLTIKKTDTGTITTILPASGLIDGGASFEMPYQHDSITIESNETNYFIVGRYSNTIDGGEF